MLLNWFRKKDVDTNHDLLILYGTQTGNSKNVAELAQRHFLKNNMNAGCYNMARVSANILKSHSHVLFVISTHDDGSAPARTQKFMKELSQQGDLSHVLYSICGMGDSSYDYFCEAAFKLDKLLLQGKAQPVQEVVTCDADFADTATQWIKDSFTWFGHGKAIEPVGDTSVIKEQEQEMMVHSVKQLTRPGIEESTYHIILHYKDALLVYEPGDIVGIKPKNQDEIVAKVAGLFPANEEFKQVLTTTYEITRISFDLLKKYTNYTNSVALQQLIEYDALNQDYIRKANVWDLLTDYPSKITANELLTILPKINTRYYSIASSPKAFPNEMHLTVKEVQFNYNEYQHKGAASQYLVHTFYPGKQLQVVCKPALHFRLPETTEVPLILIGVGTGMAPYRSFLQHYSELGIHHKIWLFWGNKKRQADFLYEQELQHFQSEGTLAGAFYAFSRDDESRKYVQHTVAEKADIVLSLLKQGAHIYVCGSKAMGKAIRQQLAHMLLHKLPSQALDKLKEQGRFHEDIY